MNKLKKYLSIMLSVVILTTSVSVCLVSAASNNYDEQMAVMFAKNTGIIGEYDPQKEITVGELANAIDILSGGRQSDKLYYEEYRYSKNAKLKEAIEVMLDIAGLRQVANIKYKDNPNAAITEAKNCGLTNGIKSNVNSVLTEEDLVILAYNLLYVKVVESDFYVDNKLSFRKTNNLYMEAALDMYELFGVVEQTAFSSTKEADGTESEYIVIDGNKYYCSLGEYEDLIGCYIHAIIKDNGRKQNIVCICDDGKTVRIKAEDISKVLSKYEVEYFKTPTSKKTIKLEPSANVLYNYTLYDNYTASDLDIDVGELIFIDNNNDGKYEILKIEEYNSLYIFSSSTESETIMDPYGYSLSIEYIIKNNIMVDVNGSMVPASAIGIEQVATYYQDKNGDIKKLFVTDFVKKSGYIDSIDPEINEVEISGEKYTYTSNIKAEIEQIAKNNSVDVILDKFGSIAYVENSRDGYTWGYLLGFEDEQGMHGPKFKVYTEDAKFMIYELENKVELNGKTVTAQNIVKYDLSTGLWDEIGKKTMLIKYKLGKNQKIKKILTPTSDINDTTGRPVSGESGVFMYLSNSGNITPKYRLSEKTIVFLIPKDTSFEERFQVGTRTLLSNATEYSTKLYNVDENYYPEVMVSRIDNYPSGQVDEWTWNARLIDRVARVLNDRGEISVVVYTKNLSDGKKDRLVFANPDLSSVFGEYIVKPKDLKAGDIIQVYVNTGDNSEVTDFQVRSLGRDTTPYEHVVGNSWRTTSSVKRFYSEGGTFAFGKVLKVIKDGVVINNTPDNNPEWDRTCTYTNVTPVWIFKNSNGSLEKASVSDIVEGDYVYNGHASGKLQTIVIYRE